VWHYILFLVGYCQSATISIVSLYEHAHIYLYVAVSNMFLCSFLCWSRICWHPGYT